MISDHDRCDHYCRNCGAESNWLSILAWCRYEDRVFEDTKHDDCRVVYCNKCEEVTRAVELCDLDSVPLVDIAKVEAKQTKVDPGTLCANPRCFHHRMVGADFCSRDCEQSYATRAKGET